ncbi:MAG TPA: hypothetical protein VGN12_22740 [Pirellulales bacterium]
MASVPSRPIVLRTPPSPDDQVAVHALPTEAVAAIRRLPVGRCLFGDKAVNPRWLGSKICDVATSIGLQGGFAQLRRANDLQLVSVNGVSKIWKREKRLGTTAGDPTQEEIAARAAAIRAERDGQPWDNEEGGAE